MDELELFVGRFVVGFLLCFGLLSFVNFVVL